MMRELYKIMQHSCYFNSTTGGADYKNATPSDIHGIAQPCFSHGQKLSIARPIVV